MVPPAQLTAPLLSLLLPCSPSCAGLPDFVVVNLAQLDAKFGEGEEVSLETLESKGVLNLSGRESRLPLKVRCLGTVRSGVAAWEGVLSRGGRKARTPSRCKAEGLPECSSGVVGWERVVHVWRHRQLYGCTVVAWVPALQYRW